MKTATKILMAVAVGAAMGTAVAAGPGWQGNAGGPPAGFGPGSEHCMTMGGMGGGHGGGPMMGGMGRGGMGGMGAMADPAAAEARLDGVKGALKINAEQEAAWSTYAAAVTAQAESRAKFRSQMALTDPAARSELRDQHWTANTEGAKAIAAARDGLLAILTPEQKATADRLIGGPGAARRGHWAPRS